MKLLILPFLLLNLSLQESAILPSKTGKFIGKTILIKGYVHSVKSNSKSHTLSCGLSDVDDTKEALTLIIHEKDFSKNNNHFLLSLKNQTIVFAGRVKKSNRSNIVFAEADTLKINFEIALDQY